MTNTDSSSSQNNKQLRVLISGASIAGPALALWLGRYGYDVTVVERAAELRTGGSAVDYRGRVHRTVLERMGVLDQLRAHATDMGEQVLVDAEGWELLRLPASFMSGELEVNRGDLARVLYEASLPHARYVFGDSVRSLAEHADGVTATFESGESQEFDLVVGADGMHSMTRRLVFGEEREFRRDSGYFVSTFSAPNDLGLRDSGVLWNVPGRMVGLSNTLGKDGAMLVFHSPAWPTTTATRSSSSGSSASTSRASAGRCPPCSTPWTGPRTSTSTPSARSSWTAGPPAGSCCSATPPGPRLPAGWGTGWPSSGRTSWPASWPATPATTGPPSPATRS
ncbi:FAD-dependent monooxygenase [Streptacidiphilus monticola]